MTQLANHPDDAMQDARHRGWMTVHHAAQEIQEWADAVFDWEQWCEGEGRAAVVVFEQSSGMAVVAYSCSWPQPTYIMGKLEAAGSRLAERYCDAGGFPDGPFRSWRSSAIPAAEALQLAATLRRLDRFVRNAAGAEAFERGTADNWEIVTDVLEA